MSLKDINKRRASLLNAVFQPGSSTADSFHFDFEEKELAAIGYAVVHWSFLENAVLEATAAIADAVGRALPEAAKSDAFRPRLRAFLEMIELIKDEEARKYYVDLHARITNANNKRQHLVHGIWSFDLADPNFLIVEKQGNTPGQPKLFNTQAIIDFAIEVSKISMALLDPGGISWEELARMKEKGPFISRRGLRMLTASD